MQGLKAVSLTGICLGNVLPPSVDLPTKYCTLALNGWDLNTLPPGVNRQLHVTLKCNATENDPLGPVVATVTDDAIINHTAQASDTRAVDSSPDFEYTITSPIDPPQPGDTAVFNVTVHNRSNSDRSLSLTGTVPLFTDQFRIPTRQRIRRRLRHRLSRNFPNEDS